MTTEAQLPPASLPTADDVWRQVEGLLDEISDLARSETRSQDFHAELLERVVSALAAVAAAVWIRDRSGKWDIDYQVNWQAAWGNAGDSAPPRHDLLLDEICQQKTARAVPPTAGDAESPNPTRYLLLLAPLKIGEHALGVLEVVQRAEAQGELRQGYLRIVAAAAALAEDFYRARLLRKLTDREAFWGRFADYSAAVHRSLDLLGTAYAIANEGRRLLGCDRLNVLVRRGSRFQLIAVSGVDAIHRRSNLVRRLERLTNLAMNGELALWFPADAEHVPAEVDAALQEYLDESHARWLGLVPVFDCGDEDAARRAPAALVVEQFDAQTDPGLRSRVEAVRSPAAAALRNALEYDGLPLLPVLRLIRQARWYTRWEQLPKTLTAVAGAALVALTLLLWPADFQIAARGELQPQRRYRIFAPSDGIVVGLPQREHQAVLEGDILAVLRSPQLDIDLSEVVGRRQTVQEQLDGVLAARMRNEPAADRGAERLGLSAQERQLREELKALESEHEILLRQQRALEVRSPTSGHVLTWDTERSLAERPVHRGDQLLTVADLDGPWEVVLQMDDSQSGHVLAARGALGPELAVTFQLAGQPGVRHSGRLRDFARTTETDEGGRPIVPATVAIGGPPLAQARPGAQVNAKIHCGRRSIGYVWFRSLYEAIVSRVLF